MPEPDKGGAGNIAAAGTTAPAVQSSVPGAWLLLHEPAGCVACDWSLFTSRKPQRSVSDELDRTRTSLSHDWGDDGRGEGGRAGLPPGTTSARGGAGGKPIRGRRTLRSRKHTAELSAERRQPC